MVEEIEISGIKAAKRGKYYSLMVRDGWIVGGFSAETGEFEQFKEPIPATHENIDELMPSLDGAFISVWDCRATIWLDNDTELDESKLTEEQQKAIEKLKYYVICTENGGAINWSGIYFFSDFSIELLKSILSGEVDAVSEIEAPSEADFDEAARAILNALKKAGGRFMVDNPNERGLTGYPSFVAFHDGRLCYEYTYWTQELNRFGMLQSVMKDGHKEITEDRALAYIKERLEELAYRKLWTKKELYGIVCYAAEDMIEK